MGEDQRKSERPMRVGAVSYLNTKPLVYGLAERTNVQLSYDLPSRLADQLAAGQLDVALIPSIEFFQDPAYRIVSDACIGCRGPVWSVKLLSRKPMASIGTLALDEGSRTSAALVRILLDQRFDVRPKLIPLPIGVAPEELDCDAVLVIGDRAMHPAPGVFHEMWDLGEQWYRWSELPFVFAMWTARADVDTADLATSLAAARDAGVTHLAEIAQVESAAVGVDPAVCLSYLRDNLYFYLGPRERRGLELFRRHAMALGLAPPREEELQIANLKLQTSN
jgi:chorismate dehydratase